MKVKLIKFEGSPYGNDREVLQIQVQAHGKTESLFVSFNKMMGEWHMGGKGGMFNDEFGYASGHKSKKVKNIEL